LAREAGISDVSIPTAHAIREQRRLLGKKSKKRFGPLRGGLTGQSGTMIGELRGRVKPKE
jgi:hypothetical protein